MSPQPAKPKEKPVVRVGRETKGRRGKGVTTVFDMPLGEDKTLLISFHHLVENFPARLKRAWSVR